MPRDHIEELALIEMSRMQRRSWELALLLGANLSPAEAARIADEAEQDRQAIAAVEQELAA